MTIQWDFASVFDHAAEVAIFAQTLDELRTDMLNKANALVGDGSYQGQAPEAFLAAFTQMSQQSENVIATVRQYGHTIGSTGHDTQTLDQAEMHRFSC
ncbi:WXG100 family type VII secretion target [Mycobacterium fragae]|jgi:uncharacterized protein YukE|uniref:Secretion protein n=1 Tax=Mycobacterium fragae TaxID=1260918 RepID=A0A1X1UMA8_9MYCO|nr:WXG100 family type VII secretion target [Mycobacterium fragae]MCV7398550.1 WXG100 family type VII secretion target [Mycobacterium fragae]ORV57818.1 hypothetical protein AWC06_20965 [Mycobacterium fragae]